MFSILDSSFTIAFTHAHSDNFFTERSFLFTTIVKKQRVYMVVLGKEKNLSFSTNFFLASLVPERLETSVKKFHGKKLSRIISDRMKLELKIKDF